MVALDYMHSSNEIFLLKLKICIRKRSAAAVHSPMQDALGIFGLPFRITDITDHNVWK